MRNNKNLILLGCVLAGACLAPLAAHASPVSMKLTGTEGASLDSIYTDPYYADVSSQYLTKAGQFNSTNSTPLTIYCDDFYDEVNVNQVWQANITNLGDLSKTSALTTLMFDTSDATVQETDYMAAAWLVEAIARNNQPETADEEMSWAIWGIFDSDALSKLKSYNYDDWLAVTGYITNADDDIAGLTPSYFSNVNVYTPLDATPGHAGSQEYFTVTVPEPSTLSLAAAGLALIGFALRRRGRLA
ncbi:MAG: PEP-CTERM sorting domain-containing protein [Steroidobacteraceae bacterium]